jgi:hypothetical protein
VDAQHCPSSVARPQVDGASQADGLSHAACPCSPAVYVCSLLVHIIQPRALRERFVLPSLRPPDNTHSRRLTAFWITRPLQSDPRGRRLSCRLVSARLAAGDQEAALWLRQQTSPVGTPERRRGRPPAVARPLHTVAGDFLPSCPRWAVRARSARAVRSTTAAVFRTHRRRPEDNRGRLVL